jgi:hypothetical protein
MATLESARTQQPRAPADPAAEAEGFLNLGDAEESAPEQALCAGCGSAARLHRVEPGRWHQTRAAWLCDICTDDLNGRAFRRWRKPKPASLLEWAGIDDD